MSDAAAMTGMPANASIVGVRALMSTAPTGATAAHTGQEEGIAKYRILVTNEVDPYEQLAGPGALLDPAMATRVPQRAGDNFAGASRKQVKLSIPDVHLEHFNDLQDLLGTVKSIDDMKHAHPHMSDNTARMPEEKRKVGVRAFIYAASRESDNDFHLIVGRDPALRPEMYMTMEVSGLPPSNSPAFGALKHVRDAFKQFFGGSLPGATYEFPRPPIPVEIEGALFFDVSHIDPNNRPGPNSLRSHMPTIWEIHPITAITFEP
jgi:hypothetical protein